MTNELLELKAKLAEFTTLMSCGHAQVFLDPVEGTCDACTERDRVKRLEEAVLFTRQFLDKLERGTEPDDPLYKARRQYHAPLHAKLDAALSQDVEGANAGTTLSIEAAAREVDRLNYEAYPGPGFGEKFNTALVELHQAVSTKSTLHLIKEQKTLLEPVWPRPAGYKED